MTTIDIDTETDSYRLGPHLRYFVDKTRNLSIEEIRELSVKEKFQPHQDKVYNGGYSKSSHWLYFAVTVTADTEIPQQRLLEIGFPFLQKIDLYVYEEEALVAEYHTGSLYEFDQRYYEHPNFVFPLTLEPGRVTEFYVRVQNDGPVIVPLTLWQEEAFNVRSSLRQTGFGLYYGIMLALGLYNFFIFLTVRDRSYLLYTAHVIGIGLTNVAVSGFGNQYLWRDFPHFGFLSAVFISYITNFFALQFTRNFLRTSVFAPKLDLAMKWIGWGYLVGLLFFFQMPKTVSLSILTVASLTSITIILSAGIICYLKGQRIARFFLLAWGIFELSIAIKLGGMLGILPDNILTHYALMGGSVAEGILLALALADRINQMKDDQHKLHQQALKVSEQSNRLKDEFLAMVSHELRTPMNGVEGALQLLQDEPLSKRATEYVESARHSAHDMTSLIDSILGFSEIESGKLILENRPFNLREKLTPIIKNLEQFAEPKGIKTSYHLDPNLRENYVGDASRITLIIRNLVDNATKFTQEGEITLSVREVTPKLLEFENRALIEFRVKDTGIGISAEQRNTIFDAFRQGEGSFNRRFGGLGIGLAMCKRLVAKMGGEISLESELGKGSTFIVRVPLQVDVNPQLTTNDIPLSPHRNPSHFPPTVLVVEDNEVNQLVLTAMLERMGVVVSTANNGEEAVNYFKYIPVDLILMDCQMPVMDGFEATRLIRKVNYEGNSVPIIAVTANAMSGDRKRCLEAGMNDYIKKPVNREQIRAALERWLPPFKVKVAGEGS